jgi:hypothetical protein
MSGRDHWTFAEFSFRTQPNGLFGDHFAFIGRTEIWRSREFTVLAILSSDSSVAGAFAECRRDSMRLARRKPGLTQKRTCSIMSGIRGAKMPVTAKRTDRLGGQVGGLWGAGVIGRGWLPLRLPIRCQKGLKPPLLATRIRRKYPDLSAGYELLSKLQNLYAPGTMLWQRNY